MLIVGIEKNVVGKRSVGGGGGSGTAVDDAMEVDVMRTGIEVEGRGGRGGSAGGGSGGGGEVE